MRKHLIGIAAALLSVCAAQMEPTDPRIIRALDITTVEADKYCVAFSPYVEGYFPGGPEPPLEVVEAMFDSMLATGRVKCILVYGSLGGAATAVRVAATRDVPVLMNVWLDGVAGDQAQIESGIALAQEFPDTIFAVSCGSEIRLRSDRSVAVPAITSCVEQMRAAGVEQPITHQASWPEWCNEEFPGELFPRCEPWTDVSEQVDFISATVYLFWENTVEVRYPCLPIDEAAAFHLDRYRQVMITYDKPVILSEFGHPGGPPAVIGCPLNLASDENKYMVARETLGRLYVNDLQGILFSAFNEPWKGPAEGGGEASFAEHWGFCAATAPYACDMPIVATDVDEADDGGMFSPAPSPPASSVAPFPVTPTRTPSGSDGVTSAALAKVISVGTIIAAIGVGMFTLRE